MKKLLIMAVLLPLLLTACDKKDADTSTSETSTSTQTTESMTPSEQAAHDHDHHDHAEHEHHDHDHDHDHAGHDHAHSHAPAGSKAYQCADNQTVYLAINDFEGEKEAHLTVDDIVYDLHLDTSHANHYITHDGLVSGKGMIMKVNGESIAVHEYNDGQEGISLLNCQAS